MWMSMLMPQISLLTFPHYLVMYKYQLKRIQSVICIHYLWSHMLNDYV
jgi:hypothetical protein